MNFILEFTVPLFGTLVAILISSAIYQMLSNSKHEKNESDRHSNITNSQSQIFKEVQKVNLKIDNQILPNLTNSIFNRASDSCEVSKDGLISAFKKMGLDNFYENDDGTSFLIGIEDEEKNEILPEIFKCYYFVTINSAEKEIMIESNSYSLKDLNLDVAKIILKMNDTFKIAGFSVEEFDKKFVVKSQYLIDTPENTFSMKSLDFAMNSLFDAQKELFISLHKIGVDFDFVPPTELIAMQQAKHSEFFHAS